MSSKPKSINFFTAGKDERMNVDSNHLMLLLSLSSSVSICLSLMLSGHLCLCVRLSGAPCFCLGDVTTASGGRELGVLPAALRLGVSARLRRRERDSKCGIQTQTPPTPASPKPHETLSLWIPTGGGFPTAFCGHSLVHMFIYVTIYPSNKNESDIQSGNNYTSFHFKLNIVALFYNRRVRTSHIVAFFVYYKLN